MQIKKTLSNIKAHILNKPEIEAYQDYFETLRIYGEENKKESYKHNLWLRGEAAKHVRTGTDAKAIERYYELVKKTYLYSAWDIFEDYCIYIEWNRNARDRFYQPRMKVLGEAAHALQSLADGNLDELFLSEPPRVGKTTLLMFYVTWLVGREPEKANLYSAYSDIITSAFYGGCLEIIQDPVTYGWNDVFPARKIVSTNAKDETFNIDRRKRYPTLTCRSLYGTLNGACDCNGVLISDDLIGGIEEALNKDRLVAAWSKVDNNLLPRAKEKAKILWCGTRWSMIDPAGLRMDLLENDDKFRNRQYKIINLPALDENDESNFDYPYGVGFSTEYYHQRRASFERNNDMASWMAQYMGEPIERSGALFEPDDMRYYNGELPDEEDLVRIFMAVDPAFGGGDYVAAPICYQYSDGRVYVHDVAYSAEDKRITQPLLVNKIKKHNVQAAQFEANKSTASYKEGVEEILRADGYRLNITYKATPNAKNKETRIFDRAPEIRELYFLESGKRTKEYSLFMQNLFSFKMNAKNKNDDAPDSLAMAIEMIKGIGSTRVEAVRRPW
ncbi:MAG: phage terminase large subunit [Christensenellales bacterium]